MDYSNSEYRNNLICYNTPVYTSEFNCDPSWTHKYHRRNHSDDKKSVIKNCDNPSSNQSYKICKQNTSGEYTPAIYSNRYPLCYDNLQFSNFEINNPTCLMSPVPTDSESELEKILKYSEKECASYAEANSGSKVTFCNQDREPTFYSASENQIPTQPYWMSGRLNNVFFYHGNSQPELDNLKNKYKNQSGKIPNGGFCVANFTDNHNQNLSNVSQKECLSKPYSKDNRYSWYAAFKSVGQTPDEIKAARGSNVCPECYGYDYDGKNFGPLNNGCIVINNQGFSDAGELLKTYSSYNESECLNLAIKGEHYKDSSESTYEINAYDGESTITYCSAGEKLWVAGQCHDDPRIPEIDAISCSKLEDICPSLTSSTIESCKEAYSLKERCGHLSCSEIVNCPPPPTPPPPTQPPSAPYKPKSDIGLTILIIALVLIPLVSLILIFLQVKLKIF